MDPCLAERTEVEEAEKCCINIKVWTKKKLFSGED